MLKKTGKSFEYQNKKYRSLLDFYTQNKTEDSCGYGTFTTKVAMGMDHIEALNKHKKREVQQIMRGKKASE